MTTKRIIHGMYISESTYGQKILDINNGIISSIDAIDNNVNVEKINAKDCYVTPGLIDIHIHGGCGCNFLEIPPQNQDGFLKNMLQHGICGFLPTIMTAQKSDMIKSIDYFSTFENNNKLPQILGINIEGPFLSKTYKGIHPQEKLMPLDIQELEEYLNDKIKIITVASESGLTEQLIKELTQRGIIVALGHSGSSYEIAMFAAQSGAKLITHLFNAMAKFHHRSPGILGAALTNDELFIELICDGFHVHPAAVALAIKAKPDNKIILISDCIALRDSNNDDYYVGNDKITVKEGRPVNEQGTLSGSILTIDRAIKNIIDWGLADFKTAIKFTTYNPANLLNLQKFYGDIKLGMPANLVFWDKETLNIKATMLKGHYYQFD